MATPYDPIGYQNPQGVSCWEIIQRINKIMDKKGRNRMRYKYNIYIYIYIEREKDIYIYRERKREREIERGKNWREGKREDR